MEHVNTVESMSLLAVILQSSGNCEEARDLYSRLLVTADTMERQGLGSILENLFDLVEALRKSKQTLEARDLANKILAKREKIFGSEELGTLRAVWQLGTVLDELREDAEALKLYQKAHSGFVSLLGPSNKTSLDCAEHWLALLSDIRQGITPDLTLTRAIDELAKP
jgi:tetratricopeptide (TPR) repeat protein